MTTQGGICNRRIYRARPGGPIYIDDGGARFLLEELRGGLQRLAKASRRALSGSPQRRDAHDGDNRTLQTCATPLKCCPSPLCQDRVMALVAGAAVGAISQWFPGCGTSCRLDK